MIDGIWQATDAELGGEKLSNSVVATIKLKLRGGAYELQNDRGSYSLDVAQKPSAMDIRGEDGPNKGRHIPAIFELAGDSLTICYELGGGVRPRSFANQRGTQQFLVRYARVD